MHITLLPRAKFALNPLLHYLQLSAPVLDLRKLLVVQPIHFELNSVGEFLDFLAQVQPRRGSRLLLLFVTVLGAEKAFAGKHAFPATRLLQIVIIDEVVVKVVETIVVILPCLLLLTVFSKLSGVKRCG